MGGVLSCDPSWLMKSSALNPLSIGQFVNNHTRSEHFGILKADNKTNTFVMYVVRALLVQLNFHMLFQGSKYHPSKMVN